jgi:hypothetical protein
MESGAIVLFRAVVMLSCLVLVPMAAIFGSAFPTLIQSCLPDSWRTAARTDAEQRTDLAPAFGTDGFSNASAPQWPQSNSNIDSAAIHSSAPPLSSAPTWPPVEGPASAALPDRSEVPTRQSKSVDVPALFSAPAESSAGRPGSSPRIDQNATTTAASAPVALGAPPHSVANQSSAPAWPSSATDSAADGRDRFTEIEQRLRAYGAVHYHLETWGTRGELYRFQCQMPPVTAGTASPSFEAVDANALEAMQRVLHQIETIRKTARQ